MRLLRPDDVWALAEPPAAEALQAVVGRIEGRFGAAQPTRAALESFEAMYWNFRYLLSREAWLTDGPLIERFAPSLGPGVAERFAWSRGVTDAQVAAGRACRAAFRRHLAALLGDDGVLLMPTMPDIAPLGLSLLGPAGSDRTLVALAERIAD